MDGIIISSNIERMKILKSILFISFFLLVFPAVGQQGFLRGTVVDSRTFKPLTFASVYINNTTIGSSTDLQGDYLLSNIHYHYM